MTIMRSALSLLVASSVMPLVAAMNPFPYFSCMHGSKLVILPGGRRYCVEIPPISYDECVPFYRCQIRKVINNARLSYLILLVALFTIQWFVSGSYIQSGKCPRGTALFHGRCRRRFDDYDYDERPVEEQCDCVPFFMCHCRHVMGVRIKSCAATEVCCKRGEPAEETCGWSPGGEDGAAEAQYGEFPWMVAILNVNAGENWTRADYIGGGAIVHPRVVLTVAHKLEGKTAEMLKCRAGEWSRAAPESLPPQDRRVDRLKPHPNYEKRYTANDVTLLRLTEPFNVSMGVVRPLCVGRGPPPHADRCFAMGWGQRQNNNSDYSDKLKKVAASLVPRGVCWRALQAVEAARRRARGLELKERRPPHSTLRCAGGLRGQDVCTGDGGSPLVCQIQKVNATRVRYAVYGLAAWGLGCGDDGAPGVYVDVANLHDWIINTVNTIT